MGSQPSRSIEKGQPVSQRNPKSRRSDESRWILDSELPETAALDEHIAALLDIIDDRSALLVDNAGVSDIEIRCALSSESSQGGFVLNADLSRRLAENRVDLVVSLYSLGDAA
jgi:Domain of unknown function (DUF4279)